MATKFINFFLVCKPRVLSIVGSARSLQQAGGMERTTNILVNSAWNCHLLQSRNKARMENIVSFCYGGPYLL